MSLDWLVIGGGIHGVHIAARLIAEAGVAPDKLRILDPAESLLHHWKQATARTGMLHLRSAAVHHLDLQPDALQRFAGKKRDREPGLFAWPYDRPSLSLFNRHAEHVITKYGLDELHIRDRAEDLDVNVLGVGVTTASGATLDAQNVILAIGGSERPRWPDWAPREEPRIQHAFAPALAPAAKLETNAPRAVAVVGGGISAVQIALHQAAQGDRVHLLSRHALREHQFDSDPGWLGPKRMAGFERIRCLERRRREITKARNSGSVPPEVLQRFKRAVRLQEITLRTDQVREAGCDTDAIELGLASGASLPVERVILATGFDPARPGGAMLDRVVRSGQLPCAACDYPALDKGLRWHQRIRVTGPLAELELGPVSRNIAGARRAADRLVATLAG